MWKPQLANYVAPPFEDLCCRGVWTLYDECPPVDVGQWWYQDFEVDVVGPTDWTVLVAGE